MTWRRRMTFLILLTIARVLADDETLAADIKNLRNSISVFWERESVGDQLAAASGRFKPPIPDATFGEDDK